MLDGQREEHILGSRRRKRALRLVPVVSWSRSDREEHGPTRQVESLDVAQRRSIHIMPSLG